MEQGFVTIDQLAQRTGMTVRNIRAHQTRGLLPPPRVEGRTGYYGPDHIARLEFIREMQGSGFNLNAIKHILDAVPMGAGEDLLQFQRMLMAPWGEETPEVVTAEELSSRFPGTTAKTLRRAIALGLIVDLGEGRYEIPSPSLMKAGEDVVGLGVPLEHALAVIEKVDRHAQGVAREFVRLFVRDVWRPFKEAGLPETELPAMRASLERLRSLASDVLLASFRMKIAAEVEEAFGHELKKPLPKRTPPKEEAEAS